MARIYQLPSHTRLWLAVAVALSALPQLLRGPWWQWLLLALVLLLRLLVEHQRLVLPGRVTRSILLVATVGLTFYSYGRLYGPEAGVALLVSLFTLKYLEVVQRRDAYIVIVLGYFVCATALLFEQGPLMFGYVLLCMTLLTACLAGIHHGDTRIGRSAHGRLAVVMMLQAIPLTVALFLLVPRVAPLWNMQVDGGKARTGMSDTMSPGQVSELSRSSEPAFRVEFDGALPPPAERYWRGMTLSHYDGRTWQQALPYGFTDADYLYSGKPPVPSWVKALEGRRGQGPGYRYRIISEPTERRWLFSLAVPFSATQGVSLARDMRLIADEPLQERFAFAVESWPAVRGGMPLASSERDLMLSLPEGASPRARALARQWVQSGASDRQIVARALGYFRQQPFYYTLKPPRLAADPVDEFLFVTRRGFCEHYASSFTVLMRAAGVPARVVMGYQGGEQNQLGSHLIIRQYDAHAWSEVWLAGQGWTRVDPTAAVAPNRIEQGLRDALEQSEEGVDALRRLNLQGFSSGLLGRLHQFGDYVDFRWQSWVLGYDQDLQSAFLAHLLGQVTPLRIAMALLVVIGVTLGLYAALLFWQQRHDPLSAAEREYWRLYRRACEQGETLPVGLTPQQLAARVAAQWPAARGPAQSWASYYQRVQYDPAYLVSKAELRHLRGLRRQIVKLLN